MSATAGTYSVPISGPSAALAFLRALTLKAHAVARAAWAKSLLTLNTAVRLPAAVAAGVQAALSTRVGFQAASGSARAAARLVWSGVRSGARLVGRIGRGIGRAATTLVGYVSPAGADVMVDACESIATQTTGWATRIDNAVTTAGNIAYDLLHTTLVRTVVTMTATIASAMATVHWLSQGVVATRLVRAMPFLMDAVIFATNPARTLGLIGIATIVAMAIALARLLHATRSHPTPNVENKADGPPQEEEVEQKQEEELPLNWEEIAANLRIEVCSDGSVIAHGIPETIPHHQGEQIARIATDAAVRQLHRTKPVRPCPSRDDKRLFTKLAREALRAEGRRRSGPDQQAA